MLYSATDLNKDDTLLRGVVHLLSEREATVQDTEKLWAEFDELHGFEIVVTINGREVDFRKLFYLFEDADRELLDKLAARRLDEILQERFGDLHGILTDAERSIRLAFNLVEDWNDSRD